MLNLGNASAKDFALGQNLVERIDFGSNVVFYPYSNVTGNLPLQFNSRVTANLKNYRFYGTSEGAGVETVNAYNDSTTTDDYRIIWSTGAPNPDSNYRISDYISVFGNTTYTFSDSAYCIGYDANKTYLGVWNGEAYKKDGTAPSRTTITIPSGTAFIRLTSTKARMTSVFMVVADVTVPASFIPYGYQIPLTNTSEVTENLWDEDYENISTNLLYKSLNVGDGEFTLSTTTPTYSGSCCLFLMAGQQTSGATTSSDGASANLSRTVTSVGGYVTVVYRKYGTVDPRDYQTMLTKGSTAPDHYIPHRYTATYPLYIGSTKLGAEEYLDYASGKIYRTIGLITSDGKDFITADNNRFCVRRNNNG